MHVHRATPMMGVHGDCVGCGRLSVDFIVGKRASAELRKCSR